MSGRRDRIRIDSLELSTRIGVTEDERAKPQRITLSLRFEPECAFAALEDDIERTIDYVSVCEAAQRIARESARHLLETLGAEIADRLFAQFPIRSLHLELRKYVVPDTAFVAVELERRKPPA